MAVAKRSGAPDMSRNTDLAGKTVSQGGYNVTYNENGYAVKATPYGNSAYSGTTRGVAAPSADAVLSGGDRTVSGGSASDRRYMSDKDLETINTIRTMYQDAQKAGDSAGMNYAHSQAEALRSKYGYSGGTDGSGYSQLAVKQWNPDEGGESYSVGGGRSGGVGGSFSYGNAPQYVSRYQSQIDDLTAQILGRAAFEYDPEKDLAYQQYKESYTRSGERAMQDTLAQMAARTGGFASSYASSAAQQTYDNYMSALADKIPELRQLAYSMYQDEGNSLRDNLNMLAALEQGDYGKYADRLAQYNTDRNFSYGAYRDSVADQRQDAQWNYQVGRDQIADQRYSSETEYQRALAKAQMLASIGDFSGYRDLGYSDGEIDNLTTAYNAARLLEQQQSAKRSGGGRGNVNGNTPPTEDAGIIDTMLSFRNDRRAYEYLIGLGLAQGKTDGLWKFYQSEVENAGGGYSLQDLNTSAVLALGIGPISYETVERLVEQGKVEAYTDKNGKLSVRWANGYNASNYKGNSGMMSGGNIFDIQSQMDKLLGR